VADTDNGKITHEDLLHLRRCLDSDWGSGDLELSMDGTGIVGCYRFKRTDGTRNDADFVKIAVGWDPDYGITYLPL